MENNLEFDEELDELKAVMDRLNPRIESFTNTQSEFLVRLSMAGFLLHFRDHIRGLFHLAPALDTGMALFANGRAAFEAAIDGLYLANSGDEKHRIAARIGVFERLELADWQSKFVETYPEDRPEVSRESIFEDVVKQIQKDIERLSQNYPEQGECMRHALDEFLPQFRKTAGSKPSHWLSRKKIAETVELRLSENVGFAKEYSMAYSHFSRFTHPRFRLDGYGHPGSPWKTIAGLQPNHQTRTIPIRASILSCAMVWASLNLLEGKPMSDSLDFLE